MSVSMTILAADIAYLLGAGHTHIEIWRSEDEGRNYYEITAQGVQPARMVSDAASTTFRLGGKRLKFKVNGATEYTVNFSSLTEYWTPTDVANAINNELVGASSVDGNTVILETPTTGRASSLEITYSDAHELGWETGDKVYGLDIRPSLVADTRFYVYTDAVGKTTDRYKWRFSSNGADPISDFTDPVYASESSIIDSSLMSVGMAFVAEVDGRPAQRKVLVSQVNGPHIADGVAYGSDVVLEFTPDSTGFLAIPLVRGARIRVAIEGTFFVREFVVPDAVSFDLLQVMGDTADNYTVQEVPPLLTRRSV